MGKLKTIYDLNVAFKFLIINQMTWFTRDIALLGAILEGQGRKLVLNSHTSPSRGRFCDEFGKHWFSNI